MLSAAFIVLAFAVLIGTLLAVLHMRENAALPPRCGAFLRHLSGFRDS